MAVVYYCLCLLAVLYVADGFVYKRVCYYTNWSQYRKGAGKFFPESIDPFLCTHINYAFATMKNHKLAPFEWNDEGATGGYARVNALKKKNPKLKTLLSVGGWNFGTLKMTAMMKTRANMNLFTRTSIKFLRDRNFDGLDLDFEYPGSRGSPSTDKHKFTVLLSTLKKAFIAEAKRTGKPRLLLTAAVSAGKTTIDAGYEVKAISRYLDFINLMSYDLHGGWESKTGFNAPLYSRRSEAAWQKQLNVAWAATYWVRRGCPSRKLVIGMATYGRAFKLRNPASHGVGVRTTGAAPVGPFTGESGFYAYYEICKNFIKGNEWNVKWDNEQKVPYAHKGNVWVGYDNEYSLQLKVKWLKSKRLGGWMVWDFDLDDFTGQFCGAGKFPLIKRLNKALKGVTITTTTFK
ncbi:hypothetical protein NP493_552g00018 [Ridgeia piscesae]|uniref:GH18 domain-containing protein n=1 Tax=Ridgeia piscesae TaxID=27915 RepID=A0AAD9KVN9_RIDPI|nr:hypothetical protein NP493_552g00018 [Ridgeia piscesae]